MHQEAHLFVADSLARLELPRDIKVLEIGSYNVNGSVRDLFRGADYTGLDIRDGRGVDIVADCADYDGKHAYDLVVSTEAMEHMTEPKTLIDCAERALKRGGVLILTCAAPERDPHGIDGGAVRDETYQGIAPARLKRYLADWDEVAVEHHPRRGDLYATARRPKGTR